MDAALINRWAEALRSGKYPQTSGRLTDGDRYCCLGVLCVVAEISIEDDGTGCADGGRYSPIWDLIGEKLSADLASMNDSGATFAEIAEEIERVTTLTPNR